MLEYQSSGSTCHVSWFSFSLPLAHAFSYWIDLRLSCHLPTRIHVQQIKLAMERVIEEEHQAGACVLLFPSSKGIQLVQPGPQIFKSAKAEKVKVCITNEQKCCCVCVLEHVLNMWIFARTRDNKKKLPTRMRSTHEISLNRHIVD